MRAARSFVPLRRLVLFVPVLAGLGVAVALAPPTSRASAQAEASLFDPDTVHEIRLDFGRADWEAALAALPEDAYLEADLEALGQRLERVGVRPKGSSSQNNGARKLPLKIALDELVEGQELDGYDVFNLNNGFVDPPWVRQAGAFEALRPFMPMPRTGWARLVVNGEPFGFYEIAQRIEGTYLGDWFASDDGWLFEAEGRQNGGPGPGGSPPPRPLAAGRAATPAQGPAQGPGPGAGFGADLSWLGEDLAAYQALYALRDEEAAAEAWPALREMIRILDAPEAEGGVPDAELDAALRAVLDVDGALWYLAGQNLFTNFDSYAAGHNYLLYRAEEDERFHVLAWDMNESFGVFPGGGIDPADSAAVARTDPFHATAGEGRPLLTRLLNVPGLRAEYLAHYRTLLDLAFAEARAEQRYAAWHDLLREDVRADPNPLYAFETFDAGLVQDQTVSVIGQGGRGRAIPGIGPVAEARRAYLAGVEGMAEPAGDLALSHAPGEPRAGDEVELALVWTGAVTDPRPYRVDFDVRVNGAAPTRLPEAGRSTAESGEDVTMTFRVSLPPTDAGPYERGDEVAYRARVAWSEAPGEEDVLFVPATAWQDMGDARFEVRGQTLPEGPEGPILINELLADNEAALADPAGDYDDWIELYHAGDAPVSLDGWYLSDREDEPLAFALPDLTMEPGERLLIWADEDEDQGPDHASFKLSKEGESLLLSTADAVRDRVDFGPQETDISWGRVTDAADTWSACAPPSPLLPNACDAAAPTPTASAPPTPVPTQSPPSALVYLPLASR